MWPNRTPGRAGVEKREGIGGKRSAVGGEPAAVDLLEPGVFARRGF